MTAGVPPVPQAPPAALADRRWIVPVAAAPAWAAMAWTAARPEAWPALVPAGAILLAAVGAGVSSPGAALFHPALSSAPPGGRRVALTFDDGPDPDHTPRVLDRLDEAGARGTFFLVGERVERHPGVAREVIARGHEIGHHSHSHGLWLSFPPRGRLGRDFDRAETAIADATGRRPRFFRPPVGLMNPRIAFELRRRSMRVVAWSVRPRDGVPVDPEVVERRVRAGLRDGGIVLMHDGRSPHRAGHAPAAPGALRGILAFVAERGWRAVAVSALAGEPAYHP